MKNKWLLLLLLFLNRTALAQKKLEFSGQVSSYGNFSPDNTMSASLGGRYIPQLNYKIQLDSTKKIDFEASANLYGSMAFRPFDSTAFNGAIQPYRGWVRYAGRQFEIRAGLQKIDFGVSTLLRPLQWFN